MITWALAGKFALYVIVPAVLSRLFGRLQSDRPVYQRDTLEAPELEGGVPIPVVFGTAWVQPHLLWWGDFKTTPIEEVVGGYYGSTSVATKTYGYRYFAGVHWGICHTAIDSIEAIRADDVTIWDTGASASTSLFIDATEAFGGDQEDGGVAGPVDLEFGGAAQGRNTYLAAQQTGYGDIPAYRGIVSAVLNQCYLCANTAEWKPWEFQVRYQGGAAIGADDINPIKIIELALTDKDWGLGLDSTDLDTDAFTAATATLLAEGLGMSFVWNTGLSVQELLERVCTHIMGVLYVDRRTGKITITLLRDDYETADLTVLDESNITAIESYSRPSLEDMSNAVTSRYTDRDGDEQSFTLHNSALVAAMAGQTIEQEVSYDLVADADIVQELAARDLRYLSTPLTALALVGTHELRDLNIGDVVNLSWDQYGIISEVFRISWIDYGTLTDGQIRVHAVQDLYAAAGAIYAAAPGTYWESPISDPAVSPERLLMEVPYRHLVDWMGPSGPSGYGYAADAGWLVVLAEESSSDALDWELRTLDGTAYVSRGRASFTPQGELTGAIAQEVETTTTIDGMIDMDRVSVGVWCVIDDEICEVTALDADTGALTLARGIMDTVPVAHTEDATVWMAESYVVDGTAYSDGDTATAKVLPRTLHGTLDIDLAPADELVMDERYIRPYPPGAFAMNTETYPAFIVGELTVGWAHRDRLTQLTDYVHQDDADIGPEAGTTYTVRIYDEDDVLAVDQTGIATTSYTYPLATEITDTGKGRPNELMRVELWSVRDGYSSWQTHDWTIAECRGYGMFYGAYYGE